MAVASWNIIQRRIMLIVGGWTTSVTDEIRPSIYAACSSMLGTTDRAVALSAAYAMSMRTDSFRVGVTLGPLTSLL